MWNQDRIEPDNDLMEERLDAAEHAASRRCAKMRMSWTPFC